MKTIIVATDFSATSLNAAHYAIDMAIAETAQVVLAHAVSYPLITPELTTASGTFDIILDAAKNDMKTLAAELSSYCAGKVSISTEVIIGDAVEELKSIAAARKPYAIVMGVQGAGAAARFLFGSTAFTAIHDLLFPVYLIPANAKYKTPGKIGLACDLSDATDTLNVPGITSLVKEHNAKLEILYVSRHGQMDAAKVLPESKDLLNALEGIHPAFHYTSGDDIAGSIGDFIKSENLDLLILVPGRRNFFSNIFHKSVSNHVAAHLDIPLLSLH